MEPRISILFYVKKSKLLKSGKAPIYLRITVNGKSAECGLKHAVDPNLWDSNKHRVKGSSKEARETNDRILSAQTELFEIKRALIAQGKHINEKVLLNAFKGEPSASSKPTMVCELFQEHNDRMQALIGKEYSGATWIRYRTSLSHIRDFLEQTRGVSDLHLQQLDSTFIRDFEHYLKTEKGCRHNSSMKHIKSLKKVVKIALESTLITTDPFTGYRVSIKKTRRVYLTAEELDSIQELELMNQRLEEVRDLFVFQCYTGIAYTDLKNLKPENIQTGVDDSPWIYGFRQKTGVEYHIPLWPQALKILRKYKNQPGQLLPLKSNQKLNAYLKEIATLAGINKKLTTHVARHTFATTVTLTQGVPMEVVSKLLGHTKLQTTQIYSQVNDQHIAQFTAQVRED